MQDNNEAGASPAPVERALEDCRTWQALPDANGAAHVLASEVERLRGRIAAVQQVCNELDAGTPRVKAWVATRMIREALGINVDGSQR